MIAFDFAYYKPTMVEEAVKLFHDLQESGKVPYYYGGGTEFISRARMDEVQADALIDLKGIPECNDLKTEQNEIIIGSAVSLTSIADANIFPLLTEVTRSIAHRTARNKITIGGNISSHLIYRETILPFLLADSEVIIAEKEGLRRTSINNVYQNGIQLKDGEFIVQIVTNSKFSQYPYTHSKKTKQSTVNYPIVSLASLQVNGQFRVALSGVCNYPFRIEKIESELNDTSNSYEKRIKNAFNHLPGSVLHDMEASEEYRKFVLNQAFMEMLIKMEGVSE
ncbi:FAD binding domain-containing protein [Lentibacillus sp. Marseille-P4043]|uniref:FAD binding domain-containing protein n=1 Tax=Lentibacillus sp. Marseille-P4043 TaxID=2040293 RepID=UPI000D0AF723|nr:FAD binding domain-containing protein [Lentibacillus sp. Marseille-P4043]